MKTTAEPKTCSVCGEPLGKNPTVYIRWYEQGHAECHSSSVFCEKCKQNLLILIGAKTGKTALEKARNRNGKE